MVAIGVGSPVVSLAPDKKAHRAEPSCMLKAIAVCWIVLLVFKAIANNLRDHVVQRLESKDKLTRRGIGRRGWTERKQNDRKAGGPGYEKARAKH
jgi:hypothetical protein